MSLDAKSKSKPGLVIIHAIGIGLLVALVSGLFFMLISKNLTHEIQDYAIGKGLNHILIGLVSWIVIGLYGYNRLKFGLRFFNPFKIYKILLLGVVLGLCSATLINLTSSVNFVGPAGGLSFLEQIIFVWIIASFSEELLTRGLILGILQPIKKNIINLRLFHLSYSVLISAVFFACMHLMLLSMGIDLTRLSIILVFSLILGIMAGYFR
jgi:membrane protease YdiL (CAAX protease family)